MKTGLYTVSFSAVWYEGSALSLAEVFALAKEMGYDGVEIGAKRPHANPMDLDARAREAIRKQAADRGLEIPAVAGYSNFASPILEHRENELLVAKEQVKLARDLGVPMLRVFAAWRGITLRDGRATYDMTRRYWANAFPEVTSLEQWRWSVECLRELADFAGQHGVTIVLQNHEPVIRDHTDMLDMVREVSSPACQACLDCPLLPQQDDAYVVQAVRDTGKRQVHSHYGGEFEEENGEAVQRPIRFAKRGLINYPAFIRALAQEGYQGYLCYEFCHPCLGENHELLGLDEVKRQVSLAQRYMRKLVDAAGKPMPLPAAAKQKATT